MMAQNKKSQCFKCDAEDMKNSVVLRRTHANRARDARIAKGKNKDVRRET